jgi:hypothetical protein
VGSHIPQPHRLVVATAGQSFAVRLNVTELTASVVAAIEVLTALGERDATIAAAEQRAGPALQAMITDESLTVSEAVQRCAGAIGHREAARLRQLAAQAHNNKPENDSTRAAHIR